MERADKIDLVPVVLLGLMALVVGFMPLPWDPDLWFHLADGDFILSHHTVPQADPFSFTRQGALWVPHSWLFDLASALSWHHLGPRSTEALMAVVFMAAILISFFILMARGMHPLLAVGVCLAIAIGAGNTRGIRPQVFSLLLCNVVILLLVRHRHSPGWRLLLLLPLVFLLWAQLHGAVVMGLGVLAAWLAGRSFEALISRTLREHRRELGIGLAALAGSVLAVLVTPHRITLFKYLSLTMNLRPLEHTYEWQVPRLLPPEVPDVYIFLLIAGVIVVLARCGRRVGWAEIGLSISLILLALTGVRHIPLACIGVVPLLSEALSADGSYVVRRLDSSRRSLLASCGIGLVLLAVLWRFPVPIETRYARCEAVSGVKALSQLERPLRVFTTHNTGSYVLFADPARLKVFIDSRPDVYGDEIFFPALDAMSGRGWQKLFEKWAVDAVVVQRQDVLAKALSHQADWRLLAEDPATLTFLRADLP